MGLSACLQDAAIGNTFLVAFIKQAQVESPIKCIPW